MCHYCQRVFSSPSVYANHLNRPVARVLYRCHLCPPSLTEAITPVLQRTPVTEQTGNLSAPNLCAIFAHMAHCHATEPPSAWKLVPSALSLSPLSWHNLSREEDLTQHSVYSEGQEIVDIANDVDRRLTLVRFLYAYSLVQCLLYESYIYMRKGT